MGCYDRAMLQLRNTLDTDCNVSAAEVIFDRPIRHVFSFVNRCTQFANPSIRPMLRDSWSAKDNAMRARFARTYEALNARPRALPPLVVGARVCPNQRGSHPNKWDRSGGVVDVGYNEQYLAKIDGSGGHTLCNRRFLRQYVHPPTYMYRRVNVTSVSCVKRHCCPTTPRYDAGNQTGSVSCSHYARAPSTSYTRVSCCTENPSIDMLGRWPKVRTHQVRV